jgi:hypothetical protein
MSAAPPPDARILAVPGLAGPAEREAVLRAIAACDPAARNWADWPRGMVAVASAAPAAALRDAVRAAGYPATILRTGRGGGAASVVGRVILYAVLGGVLGVVLGAGLGIANAVLNPECTRPGNSGGCAIGVGIFAALLGVLGIPAGAMAGLVHGLARRRG